MEESMFGSAEDFGRVAEVFEQLPHAHGPHVLDQIQCDQRFPRIHAA
jgi:hypothetical protein